MARRYVKVPPEAQQYIPALVDVTQDLLREARVRRDVYEVLAQAFGCTPSSIQNINLRLRKGRGVGADPVADHRAERSGRQAATGDLPGALGEGDAP